MTEEIDNSPLSAKLCTASASASSQSSHAIKSPQTVVDHNNSNFDMSVTTSSQGSTPIAISSDGTVMTSTPVTGKHSEFKRKPSLHVNLPKFGPHARNGNGSGDSLNKSPQSPGTQGDDAPEEKELFYKEQKKNYQKEKQRVAQELSSALKDPSIIILSRGLKVRGKLKGWTKLWAVLKPGLLLLYKTNKTKSSHWVATVLLHCCKVIERPSKKDGFCFKVFHPLEQSIWATKGPEGETMGAVVQPLPATYLICRAPSADQGKCWMDGLELALTCSSLLVRSPRSHMETDVDDKTEEGSAVFADCDGSDLEETKSQSNSDNDSDTDDHHERDSDEEIDYCDYSVEVLTTDVSQCDVIQRRKKNSDAEENASTSVSGSLKRRKSGKKKVLDDTKNDDDEPMQTTYTMNIEGEFAHTIGEHSEVLGDDNKSLLWFLLKQVRPGLDLSRVVLPTFILEPRSFLDKLSDYYYHADLLSQAVLEDDPFVRMKSIVRWYLSGFYKKPKGLKKPYNPILGETFRCYWEHLSGSKTYYIAEQVSHHPPVSAFYVSNKRDGFVISAAILTKSKFYGNSSSALLDGQATLTLLPRGEVYVITMPYAHCKGLFLGTLSMELGGEVTIVCEKTGYFADLEFKLKGMWPSKEAINSIHGKIKLGGNTVASIDGHWDNKLVIKQKQPQVHEVLWQVNDAVKSQRLKRYTVPIEMQYPTESECKWMKVSEAIRAEDQVGATREKTILEDEQRRACADRLGNPWIPKYFFDDGTTWRYKHEDLRPWDDGNDLIEYEKDYFIQTQRRHKTPVMRSSSLISVQNKCAARLLSGASDQIVPAVHQREANRQLLDLLRQLLARQIQQSEQIEELRSTVSGIQARLARPKPPRDPFPVTNTIIAVVFAIAMQVLIVYYWFSDGKLMPDLPKKKF